MQCWQLAVEIGFGYVVRIHDCHLPNAGTAEHLRRKGTHATQTYLQHMHAGKLVCPFLTN